MLRATSLVSRWCSNIKVSIDAIKKLREETSAPMGECKKALQSSLGNHEQAMLWLRQKGLTSAQKRAGKETREGVIASFVTPCRRKAVMLEVNCETDFVAKNELFLKFVEGLGSKFLQRQELIQIEGEQQTQNKNNFNSILQQTEPANIFPQQSTANNLNEEMKIVISRLQQNIRIRRAITLHSDYARYGAYVHRPYTQGVGLQACVVQLSVEPQPQEEEAEEIINEFADDMATQVLGSPPKYLNYQQIPEEQILNETQKAREEMAQTLTKAPEHTHDKIVSGKLLSSYYSNVLLGCMPYLLSNEGEQVSQVWSNAQRNSGSSINIIKSLTWQCKE